MFPFVVVVFVLMVGLELIEVVEDKTIPYKCKSKYKHK